MRSHALALAGAIVAAVPPWVVECVGTIAGAWQTAGGELPDDLAERARAAGEQARREVEAALTALFEKDIDVQDTTPLGIVRGAVHHPTAVLRDAGVPPVERAAFDEERFPDDLYGLTPATLADLDEALGPLGLAWGAAKAFEHKRRHGRTG